MGGAGGGVNPPRPKAFLSRGGTGRYWETALFYNDPGRGHSVQFLEMDFLKTVGGKVVSGLVALAVVATAISWWQMDPGTRQMLLSGARRIASWVAVVLVLPWASFFVIGRVGRMESNAAGAALVLLYTAVEATLLAWLFNWNIRGAAPWLFFVAAALFAGVYNLFTCDWIAEKAA